MQRSRRTEAFASIRDGRPDDAYGLEALQRRASNVREEYRSQLAAHPDAISPPHRAIAEGRVRVAVDETDRRLGFSVVLPVQNRRCELDDLFVEPDRMRMGVGRMLVHDLAGRAAAAGARYVDVIANPNALEFYAGLGFKITGHASTRFGSAPRMTLDLSREANAEAGSSPASSKDVKAPQMAGLSRLSWQRISRIRCR
jgi:GNAT superfamily N-acetyltransferase